jgi:hypothetical protein
MNISKPLTLTFSPNDLALVLDGLAELSVKRSLPLIQRLTREVARNEVEVPAVIASNGEGHELGSDNQAA